MIDTTQIVFDSRIETDKLLGSYTSDDLPLSSSNSTAGTTVTTTVTHTTNIPETTFVVGVFSVDGGTTWNGLEAEVDHSDSGGSIIVYAQSVSDQVQIVARNTRDLGAPAGTFAFTVLYKVMLVAKPEQGDVEPQLIGSDVYFDSRKNYQKIAVDDFVLINGTNVSTAFTHNLGYIPRVRVFYETAGVLRIRGGITTSRTDITTSQVTIRMSGTFSDTKLYARVYYDA